MAQHEVTFPITDPAEIEKLRAGDEVTVQGHIYGIRDATQIRIFDEGIPPPTDLTGAVSCTRPRRAQAAERAVREDLHRHDDLDAHEPLLPRA